MSEVSRAQFFTIFFAGIGALATGCRAATSTPENRPVLAPTPDNYHFPDLPENNSVTPIERLNIITSEEAWNATPAGEKIKLIIDGSIPEKWLKDTVNPELQAKIIATEIFNTLSEEFCADLGCANQLPTTYFPTNEMETRQDFQSLGFTDAELEEKMAQTSAGYVYKYNEDRTTLTDQALIFRMDDDIAKAAKDSQGNADYYAFRLATEILKSTFHELIHWTQPFLVFDFKQSAQIVEFFQDVNYLSPDRQSKLQLVSAISQHGPKLILKLKDDNNNTYFAEDFVNHLEGQRAMIEYHLLEKRIGQDKTIQFLNPFSIQMAQVYGNTLKTLNIDFVEWYQTTTTTPYSELLYWYQNKAKQAGFNIDNKNIWTLFWSLDRSFKRIYNYDPQDNETLEAATVNLDKIRNEEINKIQNFLKNFR